MNAQLIINGLVPYYSKKIKKGLDEGKTAGEIKVAFSVVPQLADDLKGLKEGIVDQLVDEFKLPKTQLNKIVDINVSEQKDDK